jgi:cytochrome P450
MLVCFDSKGFHEPGVLDPDRWSGQPSGSPNPSSGRCTSPDRYLVAFSHETRQCVGIELAYAEIYVALALVFVFRDYGTREVRSRAIVRMALFLSIEGGSDGVRINVGR